MTLSDINDATLSAATDYQSRAVIVKAQVLLDRAGFSSGVIDGHSGENFANALLAFQRQQGIPESGDLDEPTWSTLTREFVCCRSWSNISSAPTT